MEDIKDDLYDFELLISTMNRIDLDFLNNMFPNQKWQEINILIINQTNLDNELKSPYSNVRVINSREVGLPQSRNLALRKARGKYCLIADDDVIYLTNIKDVILKAFYINKDADILTFKMLDNDGNDYRDYPNVEKHTIKSIKSVNSVVIAFNRQKLISKNVFFNKHFGLGSIFPVANEYVFLRNALKAKLNCFFNPVVLLKHPNESTGRFPAKDEIIFSRGALFYKYNGSLAYLNITRYVFAIYRRKLIKTSEFFYKLDVGFKGIKKYKNLLKMKLEKR